MSAEVIAAVVAGFLAIVLEVIPGLSEWWNDSISDRWKPALVLSLSLSVPLVATAVACLGIDLGLQAMCHDSQDPQLWVDSLRLGIIAFLAAQATYQTLARPLGEKVRNGHG